MKKGNVTLAASRENLQRLQLLAAQHLIDTGEKRNLVQMLDLIITSYRPAQSR